MNRITLFLITALAAGLLHANEINWPQFRGPRGDGTTTATNLPLRWSEEQGIKWKTSIRGKAWSSPVIRGTQVWLSTATEDGRELAVVCVDAQTGKIIRDRKLFDVEKPQYCHPFNSYASPTPVLEGNRAYITFGTGGTACLDAETGEMIWTRRDLECNHFRGPGSSPIIHGDLFYLNFDGSDFQFMVALDKKTGQTVWKQDRSVDYQDLGVDGKPQVDGDYRKAYATCHVAELDGRTTLLSQGSKALYAYDPLTGAEWWRVEDRTCYSGSTRPVLGHGLIFLPTGFSSGQLFAIRPGKKGEVLDAKTNAPSDMQLHIAWRTKKGVPKKPSLQLVGDLLFGMEDNGTVTCWNARTGEVHWSERIGGNYSASPIATADRVYLFSEQGKTTVVAAKREFQKLAENQLGDGFMASPAVSGQDLFLRSRTHLYRVGN